MVVMFLVLIFQVRSNYYYFGIFATPFFAPSKNHYSIKIHRHAGNKTVSYSRKDH